MRRYFQKGVHMLCGPTALAKVYQEHGEYITPQKIADNLPMIRSGVWFYHLAIDALQRGYDVTVHTAKFRWLKDKSPDELAEAFALMQSQRNLIRGLDKFMDKGGTLKVGVAFTEETIRSMFLCGQRIIFNVAARPYVEYLNIDFDHSLLPRYGEEMYHYNVGCCMTSKVHLEDPTWGSLNVPTSIFLDSLHEHQTGGTAIVIESNNQTPRT